MSGEPIQSHPALQLQLSTPVVHNARSAFTRARRRQRRTVLRLPAFPLFPVTLNLAARAANLDDLLIAAAYQIQMTAATACPPAEAN
jgi:hypothetical protein